MKTQVQTLTILALIACSSAASASEESKLTSKQVPQPVHEAFQKAYPAAKGVKYEEESADGKIAYEVKFKDNRKELEVLYSADGALIETEEEIKISELPDAVVKSIKKAHPHAKLKEAEKILNPDGTVRGYEVEIKDGKKWLELELDASGVILKTESEKDD